ncbi:MAG: hypothetical protein ABW189_04855 [Rickettsiales bacterium]
MRTIINLWRIFGKVALLAPVLLGAACGSDEIVAGEPHYTSSSLMKHYRQHGGEALPRDNDFYYVPVQPAIRDNDSYYVPPRYPSPPNGARMQRSYPTDNDSDYSYPVYWE